MARGEQRTRGGLTAYPRGLEALPTITSISPDQGATAGSTGFLVVGTNFVSGHMVVRLDGTLCTSITVLSSTLLTCISPAHAAATVDLTLTKSNAGTVTATNGFEYTDAVASPWFTNDFSTYADTAAFLADNTLWVTGEDADFAGNGVIDTSEGYGGLTQCWMVDIPSNPSNCGDNTWGRNLRIPSAVSELWLEVIWKWETTWNTTNVGAGCGSNPDHKMIFLRRDSARWAILWGNGASRNVYWQYPGSGDGDAPYRTSIADGGTYWDNAWHVIRIYAKEGTAADGAGKLWVDGVLVKEYSGLTISSSSNITGIALGRNLNQGPGQDQYFKVGRVRAYIVDPGW